MTPAIRYKPHYTIADYLRWRGDWELWNGIPVAMSPSPGYEHGRTLARLTSILVSQLDRSDACRGDCSVVVEIDWHVADDTVVRPDLSLMCVPVASQFIKSPPTLIAEILSPTTRHKDLTAKKALYAAEGVRYYLLADPERHDLEILELDGASYSQSDARTLDLHSGCQVTVDVAELY